MCKSSCFTHFPAPSKCPAGCKFPWTLNVVFHPLVNPAQAIQNEFYATAFRRKLYRSLEELQADVDIWVKDYNEQRTHYLTDQFIQFPEDDSQFNRRLGINRS